MYAPSANGPMIMPAMSSPSTMGSLNRRKSSAMSLEAKSRIPTPHYGLNKIVLGGHAELD